MTSLELKARVDNFFKESKADSLLLRSFPRFSDPNFQYFAGMQKSDCFLCVKKGKKPVLLANNLEFGNISQLAEFDVRSFNSEKELVAQLKKSLGKKIALNFANYPVKNYQSLQKNLKGRKLSDAFESLAKTRSKKSPLELQKIKEACKVSEMAADYLENFFRQGMTELEVSEKLKEFFKRMNCQSAFEPIVAFGENSRVPHHECSRKRIEGNGFLLLDFGAKFEGYCADISRTFFVGKPSLDQRDKYYSVFEAKKIAEKHLIPGESASKIAVEVDGFLKKRLGQELAHALGHGIGLEEHDFPSGFSKFAKWKIEEGQCLAIEPAFYGKEFGIRIEDNGYISAQGARMLTAAPKELLIL